jgi:hypothetical protein
MTMLNHDTRNKVVWGARLNSGIALAVSVGALLALTSCSDVIRTGQSPSYLVLQNITGGPQGTGVVESDVISDTGTIVQDSGQATVQVVLKDPEASNPTPINSITLTQYHVEYVRSDGHNVQGVDVPFAFDGGVTQTIAAGSIGQVPFTLVRVQAKQEAPLKALVKGGGQNVISTIATVTFYGQDQNGRAVSVTGNIEVDFADWAG